MRRDPLRIGRVSDETRFHAAFADQPYVYGQVAGPDSDEDGDEPGQNRE